MNQNILKFAKIVAKHPKTQTLQLIRLLTGLIIFVIIFIFADNHMIDMFGFNPSQELETYIEYGVLILALLPFLHGLTKMCFLKHKILKKSQLLLGVLLILIGGPLLDPDTRIEAEAIVSEIVESSNISGEAQIQELGSQTVVVSTKAPYNPSWILVLLAFVSIFFGITGKGTYTECLKFKEKIKKIRV